MFTSSDIDTDAQEHWPKTFPEQLPPVIFPPDRQQSIARRARQIVEARRANWQRRKQARALLAKARLDGMPKNDDQP